MFRRNNFVGIQLEIWKAMLIFFTGVLGEKYHLVSSIKEKWVQVTVWVHLFVCRLVANKYI